MHPAFLDNMSWEMAEVYGAITDQILINLARHFPFYVAGDDLPTSAFAYQAQMLAQMGQVNAETVRIIRNGLADADPALVNCLEQSIMDAVKTSEPELVKAVKKGIFAPPAAPVLSPNQYRAFDLYYKQAADKLNMVNTVMLESTQSAYRQAVSDVVSQIEVADMINRTQIAIDAAAGETITGVSSWNQALRHACDKMNNGGIVGFIDHAGHRWSAEAYVAMDVRTTMFNTGRAAVWETNQTFGNDLYIVSYHNGARPLCYPWQNKVISSMDAARTVVDLDGNEIQVIAQSDTSYGAPAGLFGINCKHYPSPFIPGVSLADGKPQDKEDNDRVYEQSQEQRRLERKLREEKRDYLTAKAQGRPQEELDALQQKCRETSGDIDEFCKSTGRARHRDREGVYTKREFPDSQKYAVADFERKQKEMIDGFYKNGGAQQNFTAGQLTPNTPIVPNTPAAPIAPTTQTVPVTQQPETLKDSLAEAYEYHRRKNGLTSAPYDPESKIQFIQEDLAKLGKESREMVEETIGDLAKKYDTPLTVVRTMDKQEALIYRNAFASSWHNYNTDTATLLVNPVKCGDKGKMVARLLELRGKGYCAYVPDEVIDKYAIVHDFGHTLLSIKNVPDAKTNFVGMDIGRITGAQDEVRSIFKRYTAEIGELEKARRAAEKRFIMESDLVAAEEARALGEQISRIRISEYSLTDADEFFAEAFVFTEYGGSGNAYADEVRAIINKYFAR